MIVSYIGEEWEGSANHSLPLTIGHHVLEYLVISPEGGGRMEGWRGEEGWRDGRERERRKNGGKKVDHSHCRSLFSALLPLLPLPPSLLPPSSLLTCTMFGQES